jgi:predicted GTPase
MKRFNKFFEDFNIQKRSTISSTDAGTTRGDSFLDFTNRMEKMVLNDLAEIRKKQKIKNKRKKLREK